MPSEKVLEKKKAQVEKLAEALKTSNVGVLVDYKGITVEEDTKLRKELRETGSDYKVVKNRLLLRALESAEIEGLNDLLTGTTALAIAEDDYTSAPKILSKYAKDIDSFEVKGGYIDGVAVDVEEIKALAKLPSKEVLIAQTLGGLNAPIQGFANVLNGTMQGLVVALNAVAQQKGAEEPA